MIHFNLLQFFKAQQPHKKASHANPSVRMKELRLNLFSHPQITTDSGDMLAASHQRAPSLLFPYHKRLPSFWRKPRRKLGLRPRLGNNPGACSHCKHSTNPDTTPPNENHKTHTSQHPPCPPNAKQLLFQFCPSLWSYPRTIHWQAQHTRKLGSCLTRGPDCWFAFIELEGTERKAKKMKGRCKLD